MRITRSTSLAADVARAFAVIASEDHQRAKVATGHGRSSASVTERPDGTVDVHTERALPTGGMPTTVSSLVGDTLMVSESQTWRPTGPDGARWADLSIDVAGAPVRLRGEITLSPEGGGSRLVVDADLTCSVPLVGRKVETAARPAIEESFDLEVRLLRERLR